MEPNGKIVTNEKGEKQGERLRAMEILFSRRSLIWTDGVKLLAAVKQNEVILTVCE